MPVRCERERRALMPKLLLDVVLLLVRCDEGARITVPKVVDADVAQLGGFQERVPDAVAEVVGVEQPAGCLGVVFMGGQIVPHKRPPPGTISKFLQ
jgi:hypothetical protein